MLATAFRSKYAWISNHESKEHNIGHQQFPDSVLHIVGGEVPNVVPPLLGVRSQLAAAGVAVCWQLQHVKVECPKPALSAKKKTKKLRFRTISAVATDFKQCERLHPCSLFLCFSIANSKSRAHTAFFFFFFFFAAEFIIIPHSMPIRSNSTSVANRFYV